MNKKNKTSLDYKMAKIEAKLLYFLYVYFSYTFIDEKSLTK